MQWLKAVVDEVVTRHPEGEILIESGSSPSGTYHLGHLREFVTCDAILLELRRRGRHATHIAYVDDLDALRKIPVNVPSEFKQYLGRSLCDIPAPDGKAMSYADYFLEGIDRATKSLNIDVQFIRTHQKYRAGFFVPAIERALEHAEDIRKILETVSGHKLEESWSPIQINEEGYLKKRRFVSIDITAKRITYEDADGQRRTTGYSKGEVKLDWRVDWPARWWLLDVHVEPFGRDHATKGGSYDTGAALSREVFKDEPPLPVPYDFVNLVGDTKKMSASKGTGLEASEIIKSLPPEIFRYFMLRYPPQKRLYFDPVNVSQLIDEFAQLLAKENKSEEEKSLIELSTHGLDPTVSSIPFTHLVASYQAALHDPQMTLDRMSATESGNNIEKQKSIVLRELKYIQQWLDKWAPEELKFNIEQELDGVYRSYNFTDSQKKFLQDLATKIHDENPKAGDGEWFHKAIYELKDSNNLEIKEAFEAIYHATIGKPYGPRAGWFLSILPRDWLIKRLNLAA
jgi:lysyl-tRNA synthetase class 1